MKKNYSLSVLFALFFAIAAYAQPVTIALDVDATEAARNVLRVKETLPVAPGKLSLFYPKWIPGEHSPTGPLNNMVNFHLRANGKEIAWQRDEVEMFAFHCTIPPGVKQLEITFEDAAEPGSTASAQLARIKWNRLLVYPRGVKSNDIQVDAALKLPTGWKYATALPLDKETAGTADFKAVPLTKFVDSPAIIGKFFKRVPLTESGILHEVAIAADRPEALAIKPETLAGWKELVRQANAMFGARHYDQYKFLLTLSDHGGSEGLEHHESSEDGVGEKALSDPNGLLDLSDLLGHEYVHSWNGKYRRPAGLATPDFEQPMRGELLWVYEGLTEYLGKVLPARSQLWTAEEFRESVAYVAADMDGQTGRNWRPLADTSRAVQFTYAGDRQWRNMRRGADYYFEGMLIWLEADILIREKSGGKLSLDNFCRKFYGGANTGPVVNPYDLNEVVAALNSVLPYDWRAFFNERVYAVAPRAPLGGITAGGWKLVYTDRPNVQLQAGENLHSFTNLFYSAGMLLSGKGEVRDVRPGTAAWQAGLSPGISIETINGRPYSADALRQAIAEAKNGSAPIVLAGDDGGFAETYNLGYHDGNRYPHLVRENSRADLLTEVVKSR